MFVKKAAFGPLFFMGWKGLFLCFFWMFVGFWGSGAGRGGESLQWHRMLVRRAVNTSVYARERHPCRSRSNQLTVPLKRMVWSGGGFDGVAVGCGVWGVGCGVYSCAGGVFGEGVSWILLLLCWPKTFHWID